MRIEIEIDDALWEKAKRLADANSAADLVSAGLIALIERECAKHLATLGSTESALRPAPRRRPK